MKKLTTNQMLIGGGVIALIYILYKKKKGQNGSNMIKDAMNGDLPEVSQSEGEKATSEPKKAIPSGETKYPIRKKPKPNRGGGTGGGTGIPQNYNPRDYGDIVLESVNRVRNTLR